MIRREAKPDENELAAAQFLRSSGYDPCFEPNGYKTFPDFDIDGRRIGVEVRSLVHTRPAALGEPLQTVSSSIWTQAGRLLASLNRADLPTSYWVRLQFARPPPKWPEIEKAARKHLARPIEDLCCSHLPIADNVSISVGQLDQKGERPFLFGGNTDLETGAFVVASMIEGIRYAIADKGEKEKKARPHGYERMWLILVNRIDNHLTSDEVVDIHDGVAASNPWERIILIRPDATLLAEWPAESEDSHG